MRRVELGDVWHWNADVWHWNAGECVAWIVMIETTAEKTCLLYRAVEYDREEQAEYGEDDKPERATKYPKNLIIDNPNLWHLAKDCEHGTAS